MADQRSSGGPHAPAGVDAPQLTLVNVFPTPLVIATLPDAETLNAELKRIILARETASESVQRSNHGGWQSTWDLHEWGGAPVQKLLAFGRTVAEEVTVDRQGKRQALTWRFNCWANVNRHGHGNQFHTHPGALWSATYYVDDGGVGDDPTLGGEFEIQDPRGVAPMMYAPYLTFRAPMAQPSASRRGRTAAGMLVVFPSWLSQASAPIAAARAHLDRHELQPRPH